MIRQLPGYVIGAAALVWVFHDVDFRGIAERMLSLDWGWVGLALGLDMISYVCRGLRWRFLLSPVGRVSLFRATQAVYAGQFANQVFPMRLGEVIRARIVSSWLSTDFARVLPSVVVERLMEGVWSMVALALIFAVMPLPKILEKAGTVLGIVIAGAAALVIYILVKRRRIAELDEAQTKFTWRSRLTGFVKKSSDELGRIGFSGISVAAFGLSLAFLLMQMLTFWMFLRAYGLDLPLISGAAVYVVVNIGNILPNAPANVGVFQFFCILGLIMFGVGKTAAAGFSIIVFFLLGLPLWIVGFFALNSSGAALSPARGDRDENTAA